MTYFTRSGGCGPPTGLVKLNLEGAGTARPDSKETEMKFLVQADFHHGVDSVAVLVDADDKDAAEARVFDYFELDEDRALEFVSVVREAGAEDEGKYQQV